MGYRDHLWRMLQPLGVYSQEGFSGGALTALGTALDQAENQLSQVLTETKAESAEDEGLELAEALFPLLPKETVEQRKESLRTLYRVGNQSCCRDDIVAALSACGVYVTAGNTGTLFQVLVAFQNPLTIWDEPVFQFWLLEQMMPCHLVVTVRFTYISVETGEEVLERGTLNVIRRRTQSQWEALLGAYI